MTDGGGQFWPYPRDTLGPSCKKEATNGSGGSRLHLHRAMQTIQAFVVIINRGQMDDKVSSKHKKNTK